MIGIPPWSARVLNIGMQKTTTIPADFLNSVEFLPDGRATNDSKLWLTEWSAFANKQVIQGRILLDEVDGFDFDTGQCPIKFIKEVYIRERTAH
jgi:hypothetical protein